MKITGKYYSYYVIIIFGNLFLLNSRRSLFKQFQFEVSKIVEIYVFKAKERLPYFVQNPFHATVLFLYP